MPRLAARKRTAGSAHVSALMSGVMIKNGRPNGILRVLQPAPSTPAMRNASARRASCCSPQAPRRASVGAILAAAQNDVKRILAYSSIEKHRHRPAGIGVAAWAGARANQTMALCGLAVRAAPHAQPLAVQVAALLRAPATSCRRPAPRRSTRWAAWQAHAAHGRSSSCGRGPHLPPCRRSTASFSELLVYLGLFDGVASGQRSRSRPPPESPRWRHRRHRPAGILRELYATVFLGAPRTHEVAEAAEVDNLRPSRPCRLPLAGILFSGSSPRRPRASRCAPQHGSPRCRPEASIAGRSRRRSRPWDATGMAARWPSSPLPPCSARRTLARRTRAHGSHVGLRLHGRQRRMQLPRASLLEGLESIATPLTQTASRGARMEGRDLPRNSHNFDIRAKDRIDGSSSAW